MSIRVDVRLICCWATAGVGLLASCKSSNTTTPPTVTGYTVTVVGTPPSTAAVGASVPITFNVAEHESDGTSKPASGKSLTVAVTAGEGTVGGATSTTLTTGTDGSASSTWVLGATVGTQAIRGSVSSTEYVDVTLTATALPATQLAVVTQPAATATAGVVLTRQPTVQLEDASGHAVHQAGVPVTASITGGTVSGTAMVNTDANGLATFTDLALTGVTGSVMMTFTATLGGTTASVASAAIVVSAPPATQLAITTQPAATATSGVALTTQPVIQLEDAGGHNSLTSGVVVTASIATGGGTLGGTTTATSDANGVATFTNLSLSGVTGTVTLNFAATLNGSTASVVSQGIVVSAPVQTIYWTTFGGQTVTPQIQSAVLPLTLGSMLTNVPWSTTLRYTAGMTVDATGRLWVISFPQSGGVTLPVFIPPLTGASTASLTFTFGQPGSYSVDAITFDHAGNLWAEDYTDNLLGLFPGPYTSSRSITPSVLLPLPGFTHPGGFAVDAAGNVYASNLGSTGTNSIAVFTAPVTTSSTPAFYLNGLTSPGGLIFDAQGNLYASSNPGTSQASIVRYNSNNLVSGAMPNIVNTVGLTSQNYEASFAFDAVGNLYLADCGNGTTAGIRTYPTATNAFSATLAPSTYTNSTITSVGCVWGIAVH